ncbi:response regulator [Aureimonas glaciei]|uniref:Response regulator n=1 Tax=Aureimonas glaciei TaxID=1776957 RepID=A0A916Y324_9HYPH|nr:response regulator [Aureimonas glaciei]GGD28761.1 response regulator [Aureimonas glaciei]
MDHVPAVAVLLLEEEALVAMDLEFNLVRSGLVVAGVFSRCSEALEWLSSNTPDAVIMDVRLRDGSCEGLAIALHARGIPFVVHSSICRRDVEIANAFSKGRCVHKPCDPDRLAHAVASSVGWDA